MATKNKPFKTHWYNRKLAYLFRKDRDRPEGVRDVPEVVRLEVAEGVTPNGKQPVRIFMGTEPGQHRATRVFVWSVMKHRDPARVYEIHLMSDIAGIDRAGWKTGFTNYRYCIPHFAGNAGRAIYNDVDQVYLADPGEMFDLDMGDAGVLAISEKENSVMLIDCEKMARHWSIDAVKAGKLHDHFKGAMSDNGLFGALAGVWNCRDGEHPIEQTKCLHYTTLHTQPWEPFPDQLRYQPSPLAYVWYDLEKEADEAGVLVMTKER